MAKMTGGDALAASLHREGVRVIFGLPGVQMYHAMDGLHRQPEIRFITTRHEQAAGYMADGYARASGEIGTMLVVPGPGLQNASAAIGTAYAASSPVLVVCGQIPRDLIGVDRGVLHEINDQLDTIRPVTKWASRVLDPADIPDAVHEAFFQLKTGRPRPVEIEIPPETLSDEVDVELLEPGKHEAKAAPAEAIERAARLLSDANNPIIFVGGGAVSSGASHVLVEVAEHLQAPVVATSEGKGVISDRHYLSIGTLRRNDPFRERLKECDVVLAVGTRMAAPEVLSGQQVVQIDVDEAEIGRNYDKTFGVLGDARRSLEELNKLIVAAAPPRASREAELEAIRSERMTPLPEAEPLGSFIKAIRAAIPEDGILVAGMTQLGYYSRTYYPVYGPRTFLTSSYFGNLGFAYPVALGAKVAKPEKPVVAISGDGGFLFNSQELATAVQHRINAVVVVFNDNAFGNVLRDQKNTFDGRTIGAELHNPDFVKLAEAYGVRGVKAEGPEALESALRESLSIESPTLIEVPVGPMPYPY